MIQTHFTERKTEAQQKEQLAQSTSFFLDPGRVLLVCFSLNKDIFTEIKTGSINPSFAQSSANTGDCFF